MTDKISKNELANDKGLRDIILTEIRKKGKITFAEYMEYALYHEKYGYYQKQNPFGESGSFYTSVNASESFGQALADSFYSTIKNSYLPANICEMGAGSGMLARDVLSRIKNDFPELYSDIRYTIIEKSSYLIERQKETLQEHHEHVQWVSFEEFDNFSGIFFSNELVDAFPVHRIIKINGELKELYLIEHQGNIHFFPEKISNDSIENYFRKIGIKLINNQIADININSIQWIESLSKKLNKSIIFTIDYGFKALNLFDSFRMDGTVTCYFKHTQNNDFFERIGFQDITAFVDFSALEIYGSEAGLTTEAFIPQWLYLMQSGILNHINSAKSDLHKSSIKSLIVPEGGFGTNFHVLIQSKGITIGPDFPHKQSPSETLKILAQLSDGNMNN